MKTKRSASPKRVSPAKLEPAAQKARAVPAAKAEPVAPKPGPVPTAKAGLASPKPGAAQPEPAKAGPRPLRRPPFSSIDEAVAAIRAGGMIVVVDDEERENEGDLVLAAEFVSAEAINFMARYGRGLICLTLTEERCRQLELPPMVVNNRAPHRTAFTVSIEAAEGVTTGISAADRAQTVRALYAAAEAL